MITPALKGNALHSLIASERAARCTSLSGGQGPGKEEALSLILFPQFEAAAQQTKLVSALLSLAASTTTGLCVGWVATVPTVPLTVGPIVAAAKLDDVLAAVSVPESESSVSESTGSENIERMSSRFS
jgi:hypothetical protein